MNQLDKKTFYRWVAAVVVVLVGFGLPLIQLARFAAASELYSYVLLIPAISIYLVWSGRKPQDLTVRSSWSSAALCLLGGVAVAAVYWLGLRSGRVMSDQDYRALMPTLEEILPHGHSLGVLKHQDYLACMTLAFLFFFWAAGFAVLGNKVMKQYAFSAAFLLFMVPIPTGLLAGIVTFLQHTSAAMAVAFFKVARTPVLLEKLELHLPGTALTVAPECSGIHSTMVLLITSVLASHLFLRRGWTRLALVLAVVPLAIARNGFRIFVIGELCVHINPDMINSWIHRRGGPIFFALSLIPFLAWLVLLRKMESREPQAPPVALPVEPKLRSPGQT